MTIYDLELGEMARMGPLEVWRVPGGWVFYGTDNMCFVPYNEEFKAKK